MGYFDKFNPFYQEDPQVSYGGGAPKYGSTLDTAAKVNELRNMGSPMPSQPPMPSIPMPQTGQGMPTPEQPKGLLDSIGGFLDDNSSFLNKLGAGYFALHQDPQLQKLGMSRIQEMQDLKTEKARVNKTVEVLRAQGQNQLADLIEKNPSLAKEAMTQYLQSRYKTAAGIKTSEVKVDPNTGQQYVVKTDPNTGEVTRVNVEGATGLTPEQRIQLESRNELTLADMKRSQVAAADTYKQFSNISSQIRNLETIKSELNTGNARTGVIDQFMPAFSEATATLRSAANSLGIDVINSATFGALSATELKLALDTALPQGLDEPELLRWVDKKLEAQKKLQSEIAKQADRLASGVPYTEWVKDVVKPFTSAPQTNTGGVAIEVDY